MNNILNKINTYPTAANILFAYLVICHFLTIWFLFDISYLSIFVAFAFWFLGGSLGMAIGFHRHLSHTLNLSSKFRKFFIWCGVHAMTGPPISWVAIHREHHRYSDTENDPHGPEHKGKMWVQLCSMFHKPNIKYTKDLIRDSYLIKWQKYYFPYHLTLLILAVTLAFITSNTIWLAFHAVPAVLVWHTGSLVNSLGHNKAGAKDSHMIALLSWGEGYHKQHHENNKEHVFFSKKSPFDISGLIIKGIKNVK